MLATALHNQGVLVCLGSTSRLALKVPDSLLARPPCRTYGDTLICAMVEAPGPRFGYAASGVNVQWSITNDPNVVLEFQREHDALIYKSISSERLIVHQLDAADKDRLENIRWCPAQF
jgi:hypothetical protein